MGSKWLLTMAAAMVLALATQGFAGDKVNLKSGKWEITTTVQMPSMPAGMPAGMQMPAMTHTQCIDEKDLIPEDPAAGGKDNACQTQDLQIQGDTVTWKAVCDSPEGKMASTGWITYKGTTFEGEFKTKMPGQDADIVSQMKGRWVGPCN
jgi:hypothetical protein